MWSLGRETTGKDSQMQMLHRLAVTIDQHSSQA